MSTYSGVLIDKFGEQLEEIISHLNCSVVAGIAANLYHYFKLEPIPCLVICYWMNKIYIANFQIKTKSCPLCLVYAINRHSQVDFINDFNSPKHLDLSPIIPFYVLDSVEILASQVLNDASCNTAYVLDTRTLQISYENVLSEIECSHCHFFCKSSLPELKSDRAKTYTPFRSKKLSEIGELLDEACYDKHTGLIKNVIYDLQMPFAACNSYLVLNKEKHEPTLGRAKSFCDSKTIAGLEALERLAGFRGGLHVESIFTSYNQIKNDALNPRDFVLHSAEQYQQPNFPFIPYADDCDFYWVKVLNLTKQKSIWLPRCLAFYGASSIKNDLSFVYETSNGCAIGGSLEEAILHGILELIERDAFLMTWYKRLSTQNITSLLLNNNHLQLMYNKACLFTAANIQFYAPSLEYKIPTVFVLARTTKNAVVTTAAAGGSGFSYENAAESALFELTGHQLRLQHLFHEKGVPERSQEMIWDPFQVKTMTDHGIVNACDASATRFDFLTTVTQDSSVTLQNIQFNQSIAENLKTLQNQLEIAGFEIIVVDQTPKFIRDLDLFCVKVLIPKLVPMTFGHRFTRLETSRLQSTALKNEIHFTTVYPHPFP